MNRRFLRACGWVPLCGVSILTGCASDRVVLPVGYLPARSSALDEQTASTLARAVNAPTPPRPAAVGKNAFELPAALPGANVPEVAIPKFDKDTPAETRQRDVQKAYRPLSALPARMPGVADAAPISLSDLQQLARANSPVLKQAAADANAAYGLVVQVGLYPNPTVGYQGDTMQPFLRLPAGAPSTRAGMQGAYINQLIKTAGKLTLARQVAGYDYINALVAVRKSEVDVTTAVRTAYFSAIVAQQSLEVNTALTELADQVYALQLKQVAAGVAAGYEPLQLYAQAVQARNAVVQSEASAKAAWKQLAAAVGQPDLPRATLTGQADATPPQFDAELLKARLWEQHTDVLTVRNTIAQAQTNLVLQRKLPIPDLQTSTYQQYDYATQAYNFGVQVGIQLPISDRNQGNISNVQARIASAVQQLGTAQNALAGRLAEAMGRYEANVAIAANTREKVLPSLTQAYQTLVRRYQVEPDKVGFNDIVVAQLALAQALQSYLVALDAQWKAVVDVANIAQLDDLYQEFGR